MKNQKTVQWTFHEDLMESLSAGLIAVDRNCDVQVINARARRLLEIGPDWVDAGRELETALGRYPRIVDLLRTAYSRNSLPSRAEMSLRSGDDRLTVGYSMTFIRNRDGVNAGVSLTFKDLTRIERMAEQERLRKRLEALGHMTSRLAHQIRNPIAAIRVTMDLIRLQLQDQIGENTGTDEELNVFFHRIVGELDQMNCTVTECLNYVRSVPLNRCPHSLAGLVRDAAEQARLAFHRPEVDLRVEDGNGLPDVSIDAHQMKQVFEGLFQNAFEAVEGEGSISVSFRKHGNFGKANVRGAVSADPDGDGDEKKPPMVAVRIEDNGSGLAPKLIERIFYPFFTTKQGGSGIGLSSAQKIVDAHGGYINVESRVGQGSTFEVVVPVESSLDEGL